jgi:phosphatidylglycerophosphate synthase
MTKASQESELNKWQQIADATNDIVTPANALDVVFFGAGMYGANHLDEWKGIGASGASFVEDIANGWVARKTGTATELGEIVDATGDKIKLGRFLVKIWKEDRAPKSLVTAVALQNTANAAITLYDKRMHKVRRVHPSNDGKRAIFMQQIGLGLHVIGKKLEKEEHPSAASFTRKIGSAIGWLGVARGMKATIGYAEQAKLIRPMPNMDM